MITLYRAFSADDSLLYIGISSQPDKRERAHRRTSEWCTSDVRFEHGSTFAERKDARVAEAAAIGAESPLHNIRRRAPHTPEPYRMTPQDIEVMNAAIEREVARAPRLSESQRAVLARLLRPTTAPVPADAAPAEAEVASA